MRILDIGCGKNKYRGNDGDKVIGMDMSKDADADFVHDVTKIPWPFENNQFDKIYTHHCLEHVDRSRLLDIMNEMRRVVKDRGIVEIHVPHFSSMTAYGSPDHVTQFAANTFEWFNAFGFKLQSLKLHYTDWQKPVGPLKRAFAHAVEWLANRNVHFAERFWLYWVGGFFEISAVLSVVKDN